MRTLKGNFVCKHCMHEKANVMYFTTSQWILCNTTAEIEKLIFTLTYSI